MSAFPTRFGRRSTVLQNPSKGMVRKQPKGSRCCLTRNTLKHSEFPPIQFLSFNSLTATMPSNSTDSRPSTRSHELVILLFALGSQFNEYLRGSPLPERLTSLWCFAACYYCVRAQHYPVPARGSINSEVFYIFAFGVAAQFALVRAGANWLQHSNNFLTTVALYVGTARPFEQPEGHHNGIAGETR